MWLWPSPFAEEVTFLVGVVQMYDALSESLAGQDYALTEHFAQLLLIIFSAGQLLHD